MKIEDFLKENKIEEYKNDYLITKTKDKGNYLFLYLDNKDKIKVTIDNYFKYKLNIRNSLDIDTFNKLKKEENYFLAYQSCLTKLANRDFSVKQIKTHLLKYTLSIEEQNSIISRLKEYNLLDDEKYCINHINYLRNNQTSDKLIKTKLLKDGITIELIDKYLIKDENIDYKNIKILANKYLKSIRNKSHNATKTTILNKLCSLGYDYSTCQQVVNDLKMEINNESELLKKEYNKCKNKYEKKYTDYDLKQHIYYHLLSKGFNINDINSVLKEQIDE